MMWVKRVGGVAVLVALLAAFAADAAEETPDQGKAAPLFRTQPGAGLGLLRPPGPGGPTQTWLTGLCPELTKGGASDADLKVLRDHVDQYRTEITLPLGIAASRLREAIGIGASDAQARRALSAFATQLSEAEQKRDRMENSLRAKLRIGARPRLEAMLTLTGMLGKGVIQAWNN